MMSGRTRGDEEEERSDGWITDAEDTQQQYYARQGQHSVKDSRLEVKK